MNRTEIVSMVENSDCEKIASYQYTEGVEVVENENDGDGRESRLTLRFTLDDGEKILVSLIGWYSSYGDGGWDRAFLSEPYTYTVTAYRPVS
jgi:hypothetical protein